MGLAKEFREFISRGNMVDLAVAVVIGAAFGRIITSLVADIITPPLGLALGGVKFTDLKVAIGGPPDNPVTVNYGNFLQTLFDFLIIALALFAIIKTINALRRRKAAEEAAAPSDEVLLLAEIRDLLRAGQVGAR